VVRQIQRDVARKGRSLQRLEVQGTVIDNFDSLGPLSPPSPPNRSPVMYFKRESSPARHSSSGYVKKENDSHSSHVSIKREIFSNPIHHTSVNLVKREPEYYEEETESRNSPNDTEDGLAEDNDLTNLTWLQDSNLLRSEFIFILSSLIYGLS
jgi:hypothetical protein